MPRVELIYDADCPNVEAARAQLLRAFGTVGVLPRWQEWERSRADAPGYARGFGSPTVLVDGRDVAAISSPDAACCRLYRDAQGRISGTPALQDLTGALVRLGTGASEQHNFYGRWSGALAAVPAVGFALLPKLTCAACWPAYAALASALGLGFVDYTPYLLPLTALLMAMTTALMLPDVLRGRGYGPLALAVIASGLVLAGKFYLDSDATLYSGLGLLVSASLWNAWPKRPHDACGCAPTLTQSSISPQRRLTMTGKRLIEVFSAGCPACEETIAMVNRVACPSCEIVVLDMRDPAVAKRANSLSIRSVPAVVIDGRLADCCAGRGADEAALRAAGLGQPI